MENLFLIVIGIIFFSLLIEDVWSKKMAYRRLNALRALVEETEYLNNHYVSDVGYYHATSGIWYPEPWNSYREGKGYFWDGIWHPEPDQRLMPSSVPQVGQVDLVNRFWFAADPARQRNYDEELQRSGFGGSNERTSGS